MSSDRLVSYERFAHYKLGKGRVTLSIRVTDGNVKVGMAFCSPKDQFNKERGRNIALARRDAVRQISKFTESKQTYTKVFKLEKHLYSFEFKVDPSQRLSDQVYYEFVNYIRNFVTHIGGGITITPAPRWAVRALGGLGKSLKVVY